MQSKNKLIYWLPRILSLGFVGFISLFALDVFSEYQGVSVVVPLLIHLIPSLILLGLSVIAWKWNLVGVVLFGLVALGYVAMVGWGRPWSWYAFISGPALLVAVLYYLSWKQND